MKPSKLLLGEQRKTPLMLVLPVLLLTGCGATLPACPPASQPLPALPLMSTPIPLESYSASAQRNINKWQKQLTDTQVMKD